MVATPQTTLVEVHLQVRKACFAILNNLYPEAWTDIKSVVYSTVDDWETGYSSYLNYNTEKVVNFPLATLTRIATQESYAQFSSALPVHYITESGVAPGGNIRPVKCTFSLKIYEREFNHLENIINLIIVSGDETQRFSYFSDALQADAQISFRFLEPEHIMIPDKTGKVEGSGYLYSVNIPIEVDCTLGIAKDQKLINQIIESTFVDDQLVRTEIIE